MEPPPTSLHRPRSVRKAATLSEDAGQRETRPLLARVSPLAGGEGAFLAERVGREGQASL